jgi:hypothetical protein
MIVNNFLKYQETFRFQEIKLGKKFPDTRQCFHIFMCQKSISHSVQYLYMCLSVPLAKWQFGMKRGGGWTPHLPV